MKNKKKLSVTTAKLSLIFHWKISVKPKCERALWKLLIFLENLKKAHGNTVVLNFQFAGLPVLPENLDWKSPKICPLKSLLF